MLVKVTMSVKYVIEHINITLYLRKGVHKVLWNVNHTDCELQTLISSHPVEQYLHCNSVNQLTEGLLTSVEQLVNNTSIAKWNISVIGGLVSMQVICRNTIKAMYFLSWCVHKLQFTLFVSCHISFTMIKLNIRIAEIHHVLLLCRFFRLILWCSDVRALQSVPWTQRCFPRWRHCASLGLGSGKNM